MVDIKTIEAAADRIAGHAVRTPLLNAPLLDQALGRRVFVKAECLQKTGSFKYRGARSALSALGPDQRSKGVVAFSSGNHAQGVACAAGELGVPATIIMPADAPDLKIRNTKAYGAEVILYDRETEDRDEIGARLALERGLTLIKPFDNEMVIAGQGTTGLEIAAQAQEANIEDAEVLVCCGGGGLTAGISVALADRAPAFRVRPVEPEGFDDVARSLAVGARQTNNRMGGSICDAILTPSPGVLTFPLLQAHCGPGLVISDEDALQAMAIAMKHFKLTLEPGGAAALAAALFKAEGEGDLIVIASGGNADPDILARALDLKTGVA
ncbi:MAG: threonine ammonia-lyase [Paracoccaceae bacterium]